MKAVADTLRGRPLELDRAGEPGRQAAPALSQGRGRAAISADPLAGGRASDLRGTGA